MHKLFSFVSSSKRTVSLLLLMAPFLASAQDGASLDTGNTAWMLISTALVMLMTPAGLALF